LDSNQIKKIWFSAITIGSGKLISVVGTHHWRVIMHDGVVLDVLNIAARGSAY